MVTSSSTASQAREGVQAISVTAVSGTASSHTLCQMPVVRAYQMTCGCERHSCLPRGWPTSRGRSSARTTTSAPDSSAGSACVMSTAKGTCPPSWSATCWPATHTLAR